MPAIWAEAATLSYRYYDPVAVVQSDLRAPQLQTFVHLIRSANGDASLSALNNEKWDKPVIPTSQDERLLFA